MLLFFFQLFLTINLFLTSISYILAYFASINLLSAKKSLKWKWLYTSMRLAFRLLLLL